MASALFCRKARNIDELKAASFYLRAMNPYVIERVIEIYQDEYDQFAADLLNYNDIIKKYNGLMFVDGDGIWHCILIKVFGANEGILVEAEGYNNARYSAYLKIIDKNTERSNG